MCTVATHGLARINVDRFRERVAIRAIKHYGTWSALVGSCIGCGKELSYFLGGAELKRFMGGAISAEPRREIHCDGCGGNLFACPCGIGQAVKGLPGFAAVTNNLLAVQGPGAKA